MDGDTETIRGLAGVLRGHGATLREEADALRARAEATAWEGLAADAMRLRAGEQCGALHAAAELADAAADALDRHADEVGRRAEALAAAGGGLLGLLR